MLTPADAVLLIAQLVATCAVLAAVYVAAAWWAGRKAGVRGLWTAWLAATALLSAYAPFQIVRRQTEVGFRPEQQQPLTYFLGALLLGALCFGAATLSVRGRLRAGAERLGAGGLLAGTGAWLGAFVLLFLCVVVADLAGLLVRW